LGDRLRDGEQTNQVLQELDDYRSLFVRMAHNLIPRIKAETGPLSARVGKTTPAVVAKLRRQRTRLAQMQDMAGARVVVAGLTQQNELIRKLLAAFPNAKVDDKRTEAGYRAVHVIFRETDLPFELQIRTEGQHRWAQVSEEVAVHLGSEVKYGGGPEAVRRMLLLLSETIADLDEAERLLADKEEGLMRHDDIAVMLERGKEFVREVESLLRGIGEERI
jgi:ppGpp synthetase/RelA/SpoT-type nucleotidyltranferase